MVVERHQSRLTDLEGGPADGPGPLDAVTVRASLLTVQQVSSGGISFELEFRNDAGHAIELVDPIDQLQCMLLDELGYPVPLPPALPRSMVSPWDPSAENLQQRLEVLAITQNGQALDVKTQLARRTVALTPATRYQFRLRLGRRMSETSPRQPMTLAPGSYALVLTCTLLSASQTQPGSRILQSSPLQTRLQ
ncbi:MAG: hypothetical protein KDK91_17795 [Gammaproteobacteria bacterium]|nr:hypothetical protein [Gammaproteobacteria bacterium]